VTNISDGTRLVDEEQFGPILPVIKYSDVDDAIRRANNSSAGLGGSIWSSDIEKAAALVGRLEAGSVSGSGFSVGQHARGYPTQRTDGRHETVRGRM
jgi:acyl-CoA reductase-like NAD-dependent aldehyde dehydrogenase